MFVSWMQIDVLYLSFAQTNKQTNPDEHGDVNSNPITHFGTSQTKVSERAL